MSGSQPVPPQQYHPSSMFSMSQGQMMYNPHQHPSPWMSNTLHGISGPGGPTTLPYSFNPLPQLPPGIPPYSTVGIPMRPYELANVIQPQLDSFKQMPVATQRQVQSDTVYSDPASENRNRYARAKNEPSKHTLRRERHDQADRARHLIHLSDLETSDSTRLSIDRKALQDQLRAATPRNIASCLLYTSPSPRD